MAFFLHFLFYQQVWLYSDDAVCWIHFFHILSPCLRTCSRLIPRSLVKWCQPCHPEVSEDEGKWDPGFVPWYSEVKYENRRISFHFPHDEWPTSSHNVFIAIGFRESHRKALFILLLNHVISDVQEQLLKCLLWYIVQYLIPHHLHLLVNDESEVVLYEAFQGDSSYLSEYRAELQRMAVPRQGQSYNILAALHLNLISYPSISTAVSIPATMLATMPIHVQSAAGENLNLMRHSGKEQRLAWAGPDMNSSGHLMAIRSWMTLTHTHTEWLEGWVAHLITGTWNLPQDKCICWADFWVLLFDLCDYFKKAFKCQRSLY